MRESQEAQNRKYLIDKILIALGWQLDGPQVTVIEDEIGPLPSGGLVSPGESRFLDYHGIEREGFRPKQSLVLTEAKRLAKDLPNPKTAGFLDHSRVMSEV